jgi:acyl-coenzyme A synthetase/AMP-(fatty) acid ligase
MREKMYKQMVEQKNKAYVLEKNRIWTYDDLRHYCSYYNYIFREGNCRKILISARQGFIAYSAVIAAYMTGSIFCTINPELPKQRKEYMIGIFRPDIILCEESDEISSTEGIQKLFLNRVEEACQGFTSVPIQKEFEHSIAYVLFTSGSTGMPKGCMIKRKSIEKFCLWAAEDFSLSDKDIYGQYVPLYFDMSLLDIFGGAVKGVTLVPFPNFPEKLRPGDMLKKYKITFMNVVPQFLELLMRTEQFTAEYLNTLRMIRFGGDKIYTSRLEELFRQVPDIKVVSTYGPTETTCFCFYKIVDQNTYKQHSMDIVTIGNTIPGWKAYLRDPEEGVGEIVIYGEYIGAGYLEQQGEQFSEEIIHGSREEVYYTGDYASMLFGEYYFQGRRDAQVKINGNRVSLTEVEFSMMENGCTETAAIFHRDHIFAFYCTEKEQLLKEAEFKALLQRKLPAYAVPSRLLLLKELPHSPNGKIDRSRLRESAEQMINIE